MQVVLADSTDRRERAQTTKRCIELRLSGLQWPLHNIMMRRAAFQLRLVMQWEMPTVSKMTDKTFITPPDAMVEYQGFFQKNAVEDFTAIAFFKFYDFKYFQRRDANFHYKKVREFAISQCKPKEMAAMLADWRFGVGARKEYWNRLYRERQLARHVDRLEDDVMDRSEIVSGGLTKQVSEYVESPLDFSFSTEASVDIDKDENKVEEVAAIHYRDCHERWEQLKSAYSRKEKEKDATDDNTSNLHPDIVVNSSLDLSEEQPATPDLYSDDVGDIDGPDGLIDQDDHFDDSSEGEKFDTADATVEITNNSSVSRKKRKAKARAFDRSSRGSFERRYKALGRKWTLSSGTVVEDRLYEIGLDCDIYLPIHSFMVDTDDRWLEEQFDPEDWLEICSNWPESFDGVTDLDSLLKAITQRPEEIEKRLVFRCLEDWYDIYSDEPSPFLIADRLSESWWQNEVWGIVRKLTNGVPNCKMLPGDVAGLESKKRQNRVCHNAATGTMGRAKMGKRGDMFWRSFDEPAKDWAVIEAAKSWNVFGHKYIVETSSKLPRQMHDILLHRTKEIRSPDKMRRVIVPGLVIGGPVVQQMQLCWGLEGVNVTRFAKTEATRLESSVELLSDSLDAIIAILLFRTTVMDFMGAYESERKRINKTQIAIRRAALAGPVRLKGQEQDARYMPQDLLHSSP
ncbi:hypothetical protein BGW38_000858 [Lunasporangiospora selenospora]|uniref:Uncharacterized protein n=1 Tax=Lunasporangiospora selenospora TaxID=979761 RepID=A0A9P6FUI8_9FUNG|nr:hypothetical protein BGW38_000858 [Lunasporangiospora selenospora]